MVRRKISNTGRVYSVDPISHRVYIIFLPPFLSQAPPIIAYHKMHVRVFRALAMTYKLNLDYLSVKTLYIHN